MSTRLHYSVISLMNPFSELSFQWILDIISSFPLFKSMKSNQDQRVYQLVKYRQSNSSVLMLTRRSVCHKQASRTYISDLQTSLIDVIIIRRPLNNL